MEDFSLFSGVPMLRAASDEPSPSRGFSVPDGVRDGIAETAKALGISPIDLATAISYETGGTFDPTKAGPTTKWGQHRGLIQFGEPQAKEHGVDWSDPVGSQLGANGAVASYLRSAGVKPGMGLLDIYSAINAGAPGLYDRSDAAAGGAPGTVRDKVEKQMAGHRANAEAIFGDTGRSDQERMGRMGAFPLPSEGFSPMRMPNFETVPTTQAERDGPIADFLSPSKTIPGDVPLANMRTLPGSIDPGYLYVDGPNATPSRPLNPSITAAAERGRGPAADRVARGGAAVEANVPAMAPQPAVDPMRNETGLQTRQLQVAAEEQRQGQAPTPTGQAVGGLGGLGGFAIPGTNTVVPASGKPASSVESLLPFSKPNPFAFFGRPAQENQEAELKHRGVVAAANQLVAQGMSPEQAVATVYSPHIGQQLALSGVKQQRDAVVSTDITGRLGMIAPITPPGIAGQPSTPPVSSAAGAGGSPSAPKPTQPQAVPSAATGSPSATSAPATDAQARISTGNKTVDALFTLREQKLREYRQTSDLTARAANSPAAEAAVKARLDAIKTEIGGIDEQMKQYAPTGTIKEYVYAMNQRREQGLPVITMEQFDQEQRRAGAANVNVGGGSDAQIFTAMEKGAEAAQTAANGLQSIREARRAVAGGGFFGAGADWKLGLQKAAAGLGIGDEESLSKIVNTETFRSAIAPQVAATMRATVGSTQISNADREFAEKAAGGSITLDEKSIVRLLDIMERAGTDIVQRHQKKLDTVYPESAGKFARERALFGVAVPAAPTTEAQEKAGGASGAPSPAPDQGAVKPDASPPVQGARQAPDGNWYVPDPSRPGKYQRVLQ